MRDFTTMATLIGMLALAPARAGAEADGRCAAACRAAATVDERIARDQRGPSLRLPQTLLLLSAYPTCVSDTRTNRERIGAHLASWMQIETDQLFADALPIERDWFAAHARLSRRNVESRAELRRSLAVPAGKSPPGDIPVEWPDLSQLSIARLPSLFAAFLTSGEPLSSIPKPLRAPVAALCPPSAKEMDVRCLSYWLARYLRGDEEGATRAALLRAVERFAKILAVSATKGQDLLSLSHLTYELMPFASAAAQALRDDASVETKARDRAADAATSLAASAMASMPLARHPSERALAAVALTVGCRGRDHLGPFEILRAARRGDAARDTGAPSRDPHGADSRRPAAGSHDGEPLAPRPVAEAPKAPSAKGGALETLLGLFRSGDEVRAELEKLRKLAVAPDATGLYEKIARLVLSVPASRREKIAALIPTGKQDTHEDERIARAFSEIEAARHNPARGGLAREALGSARDHARWWNESLAAIVDPDGRIRPGVTVPARPGARSQRVSGEEWIRRAIDEHGISALLRWGVATGNQRALGMLLEPTGDGSEGAILFKTPAGVEKITVRYGNDLIGQLTSAIGRRALGHGEFERAPAERIPPRATPLPTPTATPLPPVSPTIPALPPGPPAGDATGLVPPNHKGNPGWQFLAALPRKPGHSASCGATLVSAAEGVCRAATAAHCLDGSSLDAAPVAGLDAIVGSATITVPGAGQVASRLFLSTDPHRKDSAVFAWRCPSGPPAGMKVVPLAIGPLADGAEVYYGKVQGGSQLDGLHPGRVLREPGVVGINGEAVGVLQESVLQNDPYRIVNGDSGSGLYVKRDGVLHLVGVLSTGDDILKNRPIGNYMTNASMKLVETLARAKASDLGL